MTDVKQELPDIVGKALVYATLAPHEEPVDPPDHAIVLAVLGLKQERDAAIKRAEGAEAERGALLNEIPVRGNETQLQALVRIVKERWELLDERGMLRAETKKLRARVAEHEAVVTDLCEKFATERDRIEAALDTAIKRAEELGQQLDATNVDLQVHAKNEGIRAENEKLRERNTLLGHAADALREKADALVAENARLIAERDEAVRKAFEIAEKTAPRNAAPIETPPPRRKHE